VKRRHSTPLSVD